MTATRLDNKIQRLGRKEAVRIANMALRWCRRELGINRRKRLAPVWYVHCGVGSDNGEYDASDNEIYIYWNNCETVEEIIATCIHEWTHQLQPILTRYGKYSDYRTNPYEIEAKQNESKYTETCWEYIKNKTKSYEKRNEGRRKRSIA